MTGFSQTAVCQRHITIVSETFPPEVNGVANTLQYLCQELKRRGNRISVIRPSQRSEPVARHERGGYALFDEEMLVPGFPVPGYRDLRFGLTRAAKLRKRWCKDRPDAVYVATQGPLGVAAVTAARRLAIPVSSGFHTNFHSYSEYYGAGWLKSTLCAYGRWFHNRTAITLVPTENTLATTRALGIRPTALWSRGVDCTLFSPVKRNEALRESWSLSPTDLAVVYVGRIAPEKNLRLAVSCFERLKSLHPTARFVLIGDGPLRQKLSQRHPDYLFAGIQRGERLAQHYASGDLFLFPSKTDTFGNVVTEAMASGLGVVAFDDAAAKAHIRHGYNGMKADLEDPEAFVDNALRLADQPTLTQRIRAQARLDALDLDWPSQIERFENLVLNTPREANDHVRHKQGISSIY